MKKRMMLTAIFLLLGTASYAEEPASVPASVIENTRYLVGEWTAKVELAGQQRTVRMTVKPMPGEVGYLIHWRGPGGPGNPDTQLTGVGGWDAASSRYREMAFGTNGDFFSFRYQQTSESTFEGEASGVYLGKPMTENLSVERKGRDEFTWTASNIQVGGERVPDEVYHFQRDADPVESWLNYFVGQWSRETKLWSQDEGWKTSSENWTCERVAGGNATMSKGKTTEGVEWTSMEARSGPAIIELGSASDGGSWLISWKQIDANRISGPISGYLPGGKEAEGKVSIERSEDSFVTTWQVKTDDGSIVKGIETNTRK